MQIKSKIEDESELRNLIEINLTVKILGGLIFILNLMTMKNALVNL